MKKVLLLIPALLFMFAARAETIRIPLLRFDTSEQAAGTFFNPWGGSRKGSARFDAASRSLLLKYENSSVTFSHKALPEPLRELVRQSPPDQYYLRYRVIRQEGTSEVQFFTKYSYVTPGGLRRSGKMETVSWTPGGWCREKERLRPEDLSNLHLVFHGSGEIEIYEIGALYDLSQARQISADKTLDAVYPENGNFSIPSLNVNADPENPTELRITPTERGLEIHASCHKKNMALLKASFEENTPDIWKDESLEFYFDYLKTGTKFSKFGINANGKIGGITSALSTSGIHAKTQKSVEGWTADIFVPWTFLDPSGKKPFLLGFNATRNCYAEDGRLIRSGWKTVVWNACGEFGTLAVSGDSKGNFPAPGLFQTEPGKFYLFPEDEAYVRIFTPDGKLFVPEQTFRSDSGRRVLPFSIPLTDSGIYTILAASRKNGKAGIFAEYAVHENRLDQIPELTQDAVTLFPIPKLFRKTGKTIRLDSFGSYSAPACGEAGKALAATLQDFYGLALPEKENSRILIGLSDHPAVQKEIRRLGLEKELVKIQYDGFLIRIEPDGILVTANNSAGIAFGANALCDLIKRCSGDTGDAIVQTALVVDWPRVKNRVFGQMMNSYYHRNKYQAKEFIEFLRRFSVEARYNSYAFDIGDYYQWDCMEKVGHHSLAWTKEDFAKIAEFLNGSGLILLPVVQSLGHMEWWLFNRKDAFPELREDGGNQVLCTGNPESLKLLFAIYDEYIAMCSKKKETEPAYFLTCLDEVRWQTALVPEEKRCRRCAGKPKNEIFLEHVKRLDHFLENRKLKMVMWSDMINESHNGLNAFKCAEIADKIPREVVLAHWSGLDFAMIPELARKGHLNWKLLTGYQDSHTGEENLDGYGMWCCTYNWWLSATRCKEQGVYGILAQALVANQAWDQIPEGTNSWKKMVRMYGNFLMRNWSRKPLPHAGKTFFVVNLDNHSAKTDGPWFERDRRRDLSSVDFSAKEIAGIPVRIPEREGKKSYAAPGQSIPIGRKAASLILLHGIDLPETAAKDFFKFENYRDETFGPVVAEYIVAYAGGFEERFRIFYGWNVSDWRLKEGASETFARYPGDARWLFTGKTIAAKEKNFPEDAGVYQYEWVNPHPGKEIKTVSFQSARQHAKYFLLSMTLRDVK